MSSELVRFGIAMEEDLLARFDERVTRKGYATRSEAIRDLIRADLVDDLALRGAEVVGTLTMVYDHHVRELTEKLTDIQHDLGACVVSTLHVHLDHDHCLEVIVLRGPASLLKDAADRMLAAKGVAHGRLTLTATPDDGEVGHRHGPAPESLASFGTAPAGRKGQGRGRPRR